MSAPTVPLAAQRVQPAGSAIRVRDTSLQISQLTVLDPEVVAGARAAQDRGEDLTGWLITALRAGSIAIAAASSGSDLHRLEQAMDRVAADIDGRVRAGVDRLEAAVTAAVDPRQGQLAAASQAAVTRLAEGVQRILTGPEATVPTAVQNAVRSVTNTALEEITRSLTANAAATRTAITADRDSLRRELTAALRDSQGQVTSALGEIQASLAVREAVLQASQPGSAAKGSSYEEGCLASLGTIAARAGDGGASRIGTVTGHNGTMTGDISVELSSLGAKAPILVAECKNRGQANKLSLSAWKIELAKSRSNRAAAVSLGMCTPDTMPVPGQRLIVLDERTLIVGHDPDEDGPDDPVLVAAYLLLRLIATTAQLGQDRDGVDLTEALRQLHDLQGALEPIGKLDLELGRIDKASAGIRQTSNNLRQDLISRIQRLQQTLTA